MTTYTCNGPRETAGGKRAALDKRIKQLKRQISATDEDLVFPLQEKLAELQAQREQVADLAEDHDLGRAGCGADLTAQVEAIPVDGDVYTYRCPRCGNTGTLSRQAAE